MLLAREVPRAGRFAVLGCATAMLLGVAVQAAHVFAGFADAAWAQIGIPVQIATGAAVCGLCGARALLVRRERAAWAVLAVALAMYVAGALVWALWLEELQPPPFPSIADALWLAIYPGGYVAMGLLLRGRMRRFPVSVWLDGLLAGFVVAAVGIALIHGVVAAGLEGTSAAAAATNLAYPLGDVLLVGLVAGAFALGGWRPGREWLLLGAGFTAFAAADIGYLNQVSSGDFTNQGLTNLGWAAGLGLIGLAAWQPPHRGGASFEGWPMFAVPLLFTLTATGLLVFDHFASIPTAAVLLAAATLVLSVVRTGLSFRDARQLVSSRLEARTDDLTGLSNRRHFFLRLDAATAEGRRLGVLVLDLDDFKELNDTLGHYAGDLLLEEVARRLPRCVRSVDVLARLGGDEFAVLLTDADRQDTEAAAARIRSAIGRPYELEGIQFALGASVGIALFPDSATNAQALVQRADAAMYQAKANRTGVEVYEEQGDARSRGRLALSGELRRAIETDELVLHYQPICDARNGQAVGMEALVRWQHPERGLLMPGDFLDLAQRAGTMRVLTLWVLREAVEQASAWHDADMPVRISVNLSPRDLLHQGFPDDVSEILKAAGLPAGALMLEITEDTIMADPTRGMKVLCDLAELGIGLALDDFGTGWSSLAHLRRMPVEELKIDRSFVSSMTEDHDDAVIVRSTIDLARALRLRVVAEGVEDLATWTALNELGCDLIQGFGISRPIPAGEATEWLVQRSDARHSLA